MWPIAAYGNEYQKKKFIPKLRKGELIGCFGLTEPDHGSDPGSMKTFFVKDGDHYIINGSKSWITNSPIADLFIIWAKDRSDGNKIKGFCIEKGTKGLTAPYIDGKLSLLASDTGMIMLNDVRVHKDTLFKKITGLAGPFNCLNNARFGIGWGVLGAAENCLHIAR